MELLEEGGRPTLVCRAVDDDDLPLEVKRPLKEFHANKELASIHATHLEGGIIRT